MGDHECNQFLLIADFILDLDVVKLFFLTMLWKKILQSSTLVLACGLSGLLVVHSFFLTMHQIGFQPSLNSLLSERSIFFSVQSQPP